MSRITIDDPPPVQEISQEELELIFGAGPQRVWLGLEALESRELMAASVFSNLMNVNVQFNLLGNGHLQETVSRQAAVDLGVVQGLYQGTDSAGHQVAFELVNNTLNEFTPNHGWMSVGHADQVVQNSAADILFSQSNTLLRATGVPSAGTDGSQVISGNNAGWVTCDYHGLPSVAVRGADGSLSVWTGTAWQGLSSTCDQLIGGHSYAAGANFLMVGQGRVLGWDGSKFSDAPTGPVNAGWATCDYQGRQSVALLDTAGSVWVWTGSIWTAIGHSAMKGADGSIWFLGTKTVDAAGDHAIYRLSNGQMTSMYVMSGPIGSEWLALGGPASAIGMPTGDEQDAGDGVGRIVKFQNNWVIYWSSQTGAHLLGAGIFAEYMASADEKGSNSGMSTQQVLGAPISDESDALGVAGARVVHFQGGDIYWSAATGAHEVHGSILKQWLSAGGPASPFGLPTSDEYAWVETVAPVGLSLVDQLVNRGRISEFQHGEIRCDQTGISVQLYLDGYDQQGSDPNSCGFNSAARVMRYYGYPAHMDALQSQFNAMDPVLSAVGLGAPGSDLANIMHDAGYQAATYEHSSFDQVLALLAAGHPVVANIRDGTVDFSYQTDWGSLGTGHGIGGAIGTTLNHIGGAAGQDMDAVVQQVAFPQLHWIALDGYDPAKQMIFYTDTNGQHYQISYAAFQSEWNWTSGNAVATQALRARGVVPGSIVY